MQPKPIGSSVNIKLVVTVLVDAIKDYRRRWRLFVGILALGWWPMIVVEVWLLGAFGEPFFARMEPFFFRFSSGDPFDMAAALADLDAATLLMFFAIVYGLEILNTVFVQNIITVPLIRAAAGSTSIGQSYRVGLWYYLNMIGVGILTPVLIVLPSLLLFVPLCGILFIATNLDRQLWLNIIAVLLLMGGLILLVISSLIVLIRCALAPQAIVLEGRGAVAALWRSWRMVHPWRPMFSIFALRMFLAGPWVLLGFVLPQVERDLSQLVFQSTSVSMLEQFLVSHAIGQFLSGLFIPLLIIASTLLFQRLASITPPAPAVSPAESMPYPASRV